MRNYFPYCKFRRFALRINGDNYLSKDDQNSVDPHFPVYQKSSDQQFDPSFHRPWKSMFDLNREKQSIAPNQRRTERISEAYLLSTPLNYPTQDERRDFLSGLSPLSDYLLIRMKLRRV
jgi:hypothetical protein